MGLRSSRAMSAPISAAASSSWRPTTSRCSSAGSPTGRRASSSRSYRWSRAGPRVRRWRRCSRRERAGRREGLLAMAMAAHDMVIDHAGGLHEGVADGRAHELEAGLLQGLGHGVAFRRPARHLLQAFRPVLLRLAADEAPQELRERPFALDQREIGLGVADARFDLALVPDDAGIGQKLLQLDRRVARDLPWIEVVVDLAVVIALAQHRDPGEASLAAFERQKLEQGAIVLQRATPFAVMVFLIDRIGRGPPASRFAVAAR